MSMLLSVFPFTFVHVTIGNSEHTISIGTVILVHPTRVLSRLFLVSETYFRDAVIAILVRGGQWWVAADFRCGFGDLCL
jgi:hypothetical protein